MFEVLFDFAVSSGPSGENPSGEASLFVVPFPAFATTSEVSCLSVSGNTATFVARLGENTLPFTAEYLKVIVVDTDPAGGDTFGVGAYVTLPTCSPDFTDALANTGIEPLTSGHISVSDAQPLPTSKDQCKNNGWRNFPGFKNQGDCVSFVATGGKNAPS